MSTLTQENKNDITQVTEVELVYRNKTKPSERPSVATSDDAYKLLLQTWDKDKLELQEQFKILLLNRKNACIGISTIATGGMTNCVIDLKIAFATALKASASGIIIAHNHPSGNKNPSSADKILTERFTEAAKLLDIAMLDHIIVTKEGYTSFRSEGLVY